MKQRRLIWQLYPSFILLILLVVVGLGWYLSIALRNFHYEQTEADLHARARLVEQQVRGAFSTADSDELARLVRRLGRASGTRITLIRKDGLVLADSHERAGRMENHSQRPEIRRAVSGEEGTSIRFSDTLGQRLMYVALPYREQGQTLGTIRTAISITDIDETLSRIYRRLLLSGIAIVLLAAPLSWYLSRRISRPLELMTEAAQRFSRGELDAPLAETGSAEAGRLARTLNQMSGEIAERIRREKQQRGEMEAILGCMVEGVIAIDHQEQVIRINAAARQLFAVKAGDEPGRSLQELIRNSQLQRFAARALALRTPLEDELTLLGAEKRYLHIQAAPLTGTAQEPLGVLIVLHDLTRLRQLESVRRDFVANVSHELKTPITAIRGAVETLLDEDSASADAQRFLQIIFKQSERLNALVEDLLDLSRIEQGVSEGGWELQEDSILNVLQDARNACESLIARQRIDCRIDCSQLLRGRINPALLEQAVVNLLTNAIKYSEAGSRVNLAAWEKGRELVIQVEDFGCGIAEEHLSRLFERFYRVDRSRSRDIGGTGLGLAIVKHVAYAHGGDVRVRSTPGQGSLFSIVLPQETASA